MAEEGTEGPGHGLNPRVGLCSVCSHRKVIRNRRGSEFYLCRLSETDDRFRRYPRLPVLECPGFEPGDPEERPTGSGAEPMSDEASPTDKANQRGDQA